MLRQHDLVRRDRVLPDALARRVVDRIRHRSRCARDPDLADAAGAQRIELRVRNIQQVTSIVPMSRFTGTW